jgi:hypothetical protein
MSQTSDNSRTFRIINITDAVKTQLSGLNATVTNHEDINYVEVSTVSDIAPVKAVLDGAEMKYKQCSYSTFVRFKNNMSVDELNTYSSNVCPDINILYSRVDENNHTGKLVVDRLEDYNTLKSNTGDVSFYRFSPLNVSRPQPRGQKTESNGEWETVQPRKQTVQGRYARAVTGAPAAPVAAASSPAPVRGAGAGRGRGRGRPARSAAAPSSA